MGDQINERRLLYLEANNIYKNWVVEGAYIVIYILLVFLRRLMKMILIGCCAGIRHSRLENNSNRNDVFKTLKKVIFFM